VTKTLDVLWACLPLAPVAISILAGITSLQFSRRRWIVHTFAFAAMVFTPPIYLRIQSLLDPTTVLYPGPGDGFVLLLYLFLLIPSLAGYSMFCYANRRRKVIEGAH
jgi:hypothetical protein